MSYKFGGLIIRKADGISNEEVLTVLKKENFKAVRNVSMDEATSGEFSQIGFSRIGDNVLVLNRDIAYSCSFDPAEPSKLNDRLELLSKGRGILCFHIFSPSGSYAWSIFENGKWIRGRSVSDGASLSDFGKATVFDQNIEPNEDGVIKLIGNFLDKPFFSLIQDNDPKVKAYDS
ncbi:MAG: hypothetical protein C5B52_17435 [Bacteroidetes bacterium]|nr:MAG: hypothetical protein C5B52_17435 [Bacteroidota bacterium]